MFRLLYNDRGRTIGVKAAQTTRYLITHDYINQSLSNDFDVGPEVTN